MNNTKRRVWLEWCFVCKRRHRVTMGPCQDCDVYEVPQPISPAVADGCGRHYRRDGCEAYLAHQAVYEENKT